MLVKSQFVFSCTKKESNFSDLMRMLYQDLFVPLFFISIRLLIWIDKIYDICEAQRQHFVDIYCKIGHGPRQGTFRESLLLALSNLQT